MSLVTGEIRTVFLEATLDTILEEVEECFLAEVLWTPVYVLLAPGDGEVRADHGSDFVPVFAGEDV